MKKKNRKLVGAFSVFAVIGLMAFYGAKVMIGVSMYNSLLTAVCIALLLTLLIIFLPSKGRVSRVGSVFINIFLGFLGGYPADSNKSKK